MTLRARNGLNASDAPISRHKSTAHSIAFTSAPRDRKLTSIIGAAVGSALASFAVPRDATRTTLGLSVSHWLLGSRDASYGDASGNSMMTS